MDDRRNKILQAIIETFIQTATPIGSKFIYDEYDFDVSPATIRSEMSRLEDEGYITQPHTSAGRIPTSRAYRQLVNQMSLSSTVVNKARKDLMQAKKQQLLKKAKEKLYETVSLLASITNDICFATVPDKSHVFYIGISNILKKPEFAVDSEKTTQVLEVLENELFDVLKNLDINDEGTIHIGNENIIPEFQSCSLLAQPYLYNKFSGIMGILGPIRMDYPYNMAALKLSTQLLNE